MTDTACNQDIVDAIDRRIGSINTLYALSVTTILIMLLLAVIGYFSVSKTNAILEEFVSEVKLNSKDRTTTALMVQSFNGLTAVAVIITWSAALFKVEEISRKDKSRLEQIRVLEKSDIEQALINRELKIQHIDLEKYIKLLDSKYSRQCK